MGKWYAGVVHSHTTRSDGIFSPADLVAQAEKKGLDFLIITDHNAFCDPAPASEKMLVIPGAELTTKFGHTNVWGVAHPFDDFDCPDYETWAKKIDEARAKGAVICMNHPLCSQCGWHWPKEPEKCDCVEVWNSPQHTDNMLCTEWWQNELRSGKKIPAVGGSDFHRDYFVTDFLDNPVTYVYAEELTQKAILDGIKAGHTTVAPHVGAQMIEIYSGKSIIGDTVKLDGNTSVTVSVNKLKKGQTLKIIDQDGIRHTYKAVKTAPYRFTFPVTKAGFICAQVEYDLVPGVKDVYAIAEQKVLHSKHKGELPAFIKSQTGAIYFE